MGRRPQPPVARPRRPGDGDPAAAGHVRRRRLAGADRQVRPPARGAVRVAGRRGRARAHRCDAQRAVPAHAPRPGRGGSRAPARRRAGHARHQAGDRRLRRRATAPDRPQPRRPRPRGAAGGIPRGRRGGRSAERRLRLHGEGLVAADRGPPVQPLGPAHRRAVRGARAAARRRRARPLVRVRPGHPGGRAVRGDGPHAAPRTRARRRRASRSPSRWNASTAGRSRRSRRWAGCSSISPTRRRRRRSGS